MRYHVSSHTFPHSRNIRRSIARIPGILLVLLLLLTITAIPAAADEVYYSLNITVSGNGTYTLSPDQDTYPAGTLVELVAYPDPGWLFNCWGGDLPCGSPVTTLFMDSDKNVEIKFVEDSSYYPLTVECTGEGTIMKDPNQGSFSPGTQVTVTAIPDTNWMFSHWDGALTGSVNPNIVVMDAAKTLTATFVPVSQQVINLSAAEAYALIQSNQGNANFIVLDVRTAEEYATGFIATGSMNIDFYAADFETQLQGLDKTKTYLVHCKSGGRSAQARDLMAGMGFSTIYHLDGGVLGWVNAGYPLLASLATTVDGSGTINLDPAGGIYVLETTVGLTAIPADGWAFSGWTGDVADPGTAATSVSMDSCKTITAHFTESGGSEQYTLATGVVGGGSVTRLPDQQTYTAGTVVTLTADPDEGWIFNRWNGYHAWPDGISWKFEPEVEVIMDSDKSVTAYFHLETPEFVDIPDANLRAAILENLGKPPGDGICQSELATILDLRAGERGISDLTGLEYCTHTEILSLYLNNIEDISPLQHCTSLSTLILRYNQIRDISPLVNNPGLGAGDTVWLDGNYLDITPGSDDMNNIAVLEGRGVNVYYTDQGTDPAPTECVITTSTDGHGTIQCNPAGPYTAGAQVTLTAIPQTGYVFSAWGGAISGNDNPKVLTVNNSITVTATFSYQNTGGSTGGTVASSGGGGMMPRYRDIALRGFEEAEMEVDASGILKESVKLQITGDNVTLYIDSGTVILDANGQPIDQLSVSRLEDIPAAPPEHAIIMAYDFGPDGVTFQPGLTLTINFDPEELPELADKSSIDIAYWNGETWELLRGILDSQTNTVSVTATHFSTYALITGLYRPASFSLESLTVDTTDIAPGDPVTVTATAANSGDLRGDFRLIVFVNGAIKKNQVLSIGPGATVSSTFTVSGDEDGSYRVSSGDLETFFKVITPVDEPVEEDSVGEVQPVTEPEESVTPAATEATLELAETATEPEEEGTAVPWAVVGIVIGVIVLAGGILLFARRNKFED